MVLSFPQSRNNSSNFQISEKLAQRSFMNSSSWILWYLQVIFGIYLWGFFNSICSCACFLEIPNTCWIIRWHPLLHRDTRFFDNVIWCVTCSHQLNQCILKEWKTSDSMEEQFLLWSTSRVCKRISPSKIPSSRTGISGDALSGGYITIVPYIWGSDMPSSDVEESI